jgi:hypothetical protein
MDNQRVIEIAESCLDGKTSPLAAGRSLSVMVGPPNPIWDEMGGAHGPLSALYAAADQSDRVYFLGQDVERWHPDVQERKRVELEDAEALAAPSVRAACLALIDHMTRSRTDLRIPTQGGQVFRFDRGQHSGLMAATVPI